MFIPYQSDVAKVHPFEYLPCGAIQPKQGLALLQSSGNLAIASGTNKPTYICVRQEESAVSAGTVIPVVRVDDETIFSTEFSASGSSFALGTKVTIASDGLRVTTTSTSGVAEVVWVEGFTGATGNVTSGTKCRVRFS